MEYSVYDLIRILLKKWYIVLLGMAIIAGLAVILSQISYAGAVKNYAQFTSETAAGSDVQTDDVNTELAQIVMQKPEQAPSPIRTACKGAAFGFLLSCFGLLLYTFMKDTAPADKRRRAGEKQE